MDRDTLSAYTSKRMTIRKIAELEGVSASTVRYWLGKYDLSTGNYIRHQWDLDKLRLAAESATSKREILLALGLRDSGSIYTIMSKVAEEAGIPLPEFTNSGRPSPQALSAEELFVFGRSVKGHTLRRHMVNTFGIPEECAFCALTDWRGESITLEVDHIDGDHRNNLIENLRFLCPNCHSQTETYNRRKSKS